MAALTLRGIPDELYEILKKRARENHRSLNGEILERLEHSLRVARPAADDIIARAQARAKRVTTPRLTPAFLRTLEDEGRS